MTNLKTGLSAILLAALPLLAAYAHVAEAAGKNRGGNEASLRTTQNNATKKGAATRIAARSQTRSTSRSTQVDPTSGRLNQRRQANRAEYNRCASFSLSVLQGCMSQTTGNPQKERACRTHYQGNIVRCQQLL